MFIYIVTSSILYLLYCYHIQTNFVLFWTISDSPQGLLLALAQWSFLGAFGCPHDHMGYQGWNQSWLHTSQTNCLVVLSLWSHLIHFNAPKCPNKWVWKLFIWISWMTQISTVTVNIMNIPEYVILWAWNVIFRLNYLRKKYWVN